MSLRHRGSAWIAAAALASLASAAPAQDYGLCVKLEARLVELERGSSGASSVNIQRYDSALVEQQRQLTVARQQAQRAGCGPQTGFLFFRPQRPAGCAQHDAAIDRLQANVQRLQSRRSGALTISAGPNETERRRILAMLGENRCGPQYERYAPDRNRGLFGLFFRDYTRDPYATEPGIGADFHGTYRTLCVRTCDGYYWPVSFSTVQSHFDYDEQLCKASCPASEVALYVHRNPGEGPEEAMSLVGAPYSQMPNAFRYRTEYVDDCSCKAGIQTAALGERVVVDFAAQDGTPQGEPEGIVAGPGPEPEPVAAPVPLPRSRPGNEPPVAGSIATLTGLEDYHAVPAPSVSRTAGRAVRVVGPGFTLYRSGAE